jgi:hypothetical protein
MCELNRSINFVKGLNLLKESVTTKQLALNYREIALLKKELEATEISLKSQLIERGDTIMLPATKEKVAYSEGRDKTEIEVMSVFKELKKQKRLTDFMSIVTLTKTKLEKIEDGKILSDKYSKVVGKSSPSISFKKMSKKDLVEYSYK